MSRRAWYGSWPVVVVSALALPPLGLLLLWMRRGTGLGIKLAGSLAILILMVGYLGVASGYRLQVDGTGWRPRFAMRSREAHYTALERDRVRQRHRTATATPRRAGREEITPPRAALDASPAVATPGAPAPGTESAESEVPRSTTADPTPDAARAYWTDFRGPERDGRYDEATVRTAWPSDGLPLLWRQPVGGGYASFVAADGRLFTIEQRRHQEVLAGYDLETGQELWTDAWDSDFRESMGGDGPRATPTWDDGRLYGLGAMGELRCLDAETGRLLWRRDILAENGATNLTWAMGAAPLIVDDMVVVLPGGPNGRSVVAYDKLSGTPIWTVLDDQQAYTSPMLTTLAGQRQILVVSAHRAMGLGTEDGSLLWEYPWQTTYGANAAQPVLLGHDRVFLSAGYGHGAAVFEVSRSKDGSSARTIWENIRMKNKFTSSILHEGYLYGLDEAILACVDAETGELAWKGGRYGYGQVVLASGHLIVLTESGDVVLVKATPDGHEELARFPAIDGKTWNHPIIAEGRLIVRNTTEMAAFDISLDAS